ncbi:MAG: ATP-dependent RNA helicase SrmB [Methanosaeta sp. PtaB.Bin018]|jgi:DEAD/DEAH box helicase domain-containing protein|nr:DEAD/DEAH box helicase [Methanothrix sp.]OPX75008.1 MAG: ATP-dependent RNA helicase SrmB [Methanosaeta sp. PtaB.Bin018]OPY44452.1 MAG: ATP-dependent RNA helicase SrmB [Methanosaeta sp. PtaU1.Bin016]
MPISMVVTNKQPEISEDVPRSILNLFQDYTFSRDGQRHSPFKHQAETFRLVGLENKEAFLVAGTASGKTLAIAVPLFWKLKQGLIRKVLLMYPTVALLEDQRKVMDTLAEITGLEVGQLQGGMSRTKLIEALNKPVILATPDEVYWFFRKNVKYNSLLIYGLAMVDEFVLDEGHLFNGLMLRNLAHLKSRIQLLGEKIGKRSRWHILTATPTEELRGLTTSGSEVQGQSKCGDVEVTFLEPASSYIDRQEKLVSAVESSLEEGAKKVLLVFNSADLAHRVFEGIRGRSNDAEIPAEMKLRFGRVRWGQFKAWLASEKLGAQIEEEIEKWLKREEPFRLKDLADGDRTEVPTEELISKIARLLESQAWVIKSLAYSADREKDTDLLNSIDARLIGKSRLARLIWAYIRAGMKNPTDLERITGELDRFVTEVQSNLEQIWSEDSLEMAAPEFKEISSGLTEAGLPLELAAKFTDYLRYSVELPEGAAEGLRMSPSELSRRYLAFSWFGWLIKNEAQREDLTGRILKALEDGLLDADTRNISSWKETKIPAIIYTGKMSKNERRGLLDAFGKLPRAILISTPAVEVGVDFAADTLITEQCEGNGFLQRFGRVGRRVGVRGRVIVLIKDGETYIDLYSRYKDLSEEDRKISREDFSSLISSPEAGIFPSKNYIEGSDFLDATHWLVNAQIGEIGEWLNQSMFSDGAAAELAQKIRKSGLPFAYGLRATMPGVSLQGGAGGGDLFYILRKVYNDHLVASDSPFDMAQADMWHMELLWKKSQWRIVVDAAATLEASQAQFWWQDGRWHLQTGYGVAADYVRLFHPEIERNLLGLEPSLKKDPDNVLAKLSPHASNPKVRPILRSWEALPAFFSPHARFVLGMGDVYLQRQDEEGIVEPVEDRMGNPLVVQDQIWLILFGHDRVQTERLLSAISVFGLEELICDLQTLEVQGSRITGPVILEKSAGACFDVYRRLVEHVG